MLFRLIVVAALLAAGSARAGESPMAFILSQQHLPRLSTMRLRGVASQHGSSIVRASYYGGGRGERLSAYTSTGERFNPNGMTVAHRSLPFGTRLEVTNLANGRAVIVRVNDRGPAAYTGRDLDLARGAASALGMLGAGEARVSYRIIN